ncbi:MAG: SPOR domain-containing protein [Rhodobacteraceae bacterium]|nr:SPOR domain-containing protein [Paracoccaceae bacterium]
MPGIKIQRIKGPLFGVLMMSTLAGCGEGGFDPASLFGGGETPSQTASSGQAGQTVELVERDVEAPEVFQVTTTGLWDGRPSLGGVWVAHPDVTDPERVIIRNTNNGNFVIGALFRRERENPGPALQISSDAAEALGILAGSPTQLNVTALRREEASAPAPTEATSPEAVLDPPIDISEIALEPATPTTEPVVTPPAPTIPIPTPTASSLERPFIQIGIFSVQTNAEGAATTMRGAGLTARVLQQESQGRTFWRVIVGPASSEAGRAADLDKVKGLGFTDAYFTRS